MPGRGPKETASPLRLTVSHGRSVNEEDPCSNPTILWALPAFLQTRLGGRVCAALADDPRVRAGVHRLPRLQVNGDLSLRLLRARSPRHGDIKSRLTYLPHTTFGRLKRVREVAQENRVRDSYPDGRKNACSGYRHNSSLPTDQDEVTGSTRFALYCARRSDDHGRRNCPNSRTAQTGQNTTTSAGSSASGS
jgi:hypothetical protein